MDRQQLCVRCGALHLDARNHARSTRPAEAEDRASGTWPRRFAAGRLAAGAFWLVGADGFRSSPRPWT